MVGPALSSLWQRLAPRRSSCAPPRASIDVAALEDRILFSAGPLPAGGDLAPEPAGGEIGFDLGLASEEGLDVFDAATPSSANADASGQSVTESAEADAATIPDALDDTRHEIVFVDTAAENYQQLVDDLLTQAEAERSIEVHLIASDEDGIQRISSVLAERADVDAIHLLSHGTAGNVKLGNVWLDVTNVGAYADEIAAWNSALAGDADLLIYGCNLAASEDGRALSATLGALCDCDVAASIDDTGSAARGGNWNLEFQTGSIETRSALSGDAQQNWAGLLAYATYRDEFDFVSFANSDGNQNWTASPWQEIGEVNGPGSGLVRVTSLLGEQGLEIRQAGVGAMRQVDLSGASSAYLTFNYARIGFDDSSDFVDVEISGNGGGSWVQLVRFEGPADDTSLQYTSFDISSFIAANTQIRFVSAGLNSSEALLVDNFQVSYAADLAAQSEFLVNNETSDIQETSGENRGSQQAVSFAADGTYVVVWSSQNQAAAGWDVYAQRFDRAGNELTPETLVNQTTGGDQRWARVQSDATGRFVVTWTSDQGGSNDVYMRRFDAAAGALDVELPVNTTTAGEQKDSDIGMDSNGNYIIVWEGPGAGDPDEGIFFRRFNADGSAIDGVEQLANQVDRGIESNAAVTLSDAGNFAIGWQVGDSVYAQPFDSGGSVIGADEWVGGASGNPATAPSLASDPNGNYTFLYRQAGFFAGVWGKGFNADGSVRYWWFQVDNLNADAPTIAMAPDGTFVVSYEDTGDGDGEGVYARLYDPNGSPQATSFPVNVTTSGDQRLASVAILDVNNFVVVWSGEGPGDNDGVFARHFGIGSANTAPTATMMTQLQAYIEGAASVALDDIVVTDPDAGETITARLTLLDTSTGSLTTGSFGAVTSNYDPGTGIWEAIGSVADVNAALTAVAFVPLANNDVDTTIITHIEDSLGAGPADGSITLDVTPVNDEQVLVTNLPRNVVQGAIATISNGFLQTVDPDNTTVELVYTITGGPTNGMVLLSGLATATFTQADIDGGLVEYLHDGSFTLSDSFTFEVDDGQGAVSGGTFNITVTAINSEESLVINQPLVVDEGATAIIDNSRLLTTDVENSPAQIFYVITSGPNNGTVLLSGAATTAFTQADIDLGLVAYQHDGGETTGDGFEFEVDDGQGTVTSATFNVTVTPQNDEQVLAANLPLIVNEGAAATISSGNLLTTDPDHAPSQLVYTITTGPSRGVVLLSGAATVTFTQDDIDAGRISYQHDGTEGASDSFGFIVDDGQGTASGGTFQINVAPINDPPTISPIANQFGIEDTPLGPIGFTVGDVDTPVGNLVVVATSSNQALVPDGNIVLGGSGANRTLTIVPAANQNGGPVTITVSVSDGASVTSEQFLVAFAATPDQPLADDDTFTLFEDQPLIVAAPGVLAGDTDADGEILTAVLESPPAGGTLSLNADGSFTYTPNPGFSGNDQITYRARDRGLTGLPATGTLTVTGLPEPTPPEPPPQQPTPEEDEDSGDEDNSNEDPTSPPAPQPETPDDQLPPDDDDRSSRSPNLPEDSEPGPPLLSTPAEPGAEFIGSDAEERTADRDAQDRRARSDGMRPDQRAGTGSLNDLRFVLESSALWDDLDELEEMVDQASDLQQLAIGSAFGVTSGLPAGYVSWLLRGGSLLRRLLAQMPAWTFVDPLPVLEFLKDQDDDDDASVEDMLAQQDDGEEQGPNTDTQQIDPAAEVHAV